MESNRAAILLLLLTVTIQAAAAAQPFFANYLAETDTFHTRVLNAGERVDLILDKTSGTNCETFAEASRYILFSGFKSCSLRCNLQGMLYFNGEWICPRSSLEMGIKKSASLNLFPCFPLI